jgi:hypothetical protein
MDAGGSLVLFGGVGGPLEQTLFTDTWTWNGSTWTLHYVAGPPPRTKAAAAGLDGTRIWRIAGLVLGESESGGEGGVGDFSP